jgi:apolipoprotein N-acyltransferase
MLKISLLGNISQDKNSNKKTGTRETYRRLAQSSDARLIVLPETALPLLRENVPDFYQTLLGDHVRKNGGDILIGAFEKENGNYYNSVYSLGSSESQHYRKNHLVPFGEFIPLRSVPAGSSTKCCKSPWATRPAAARTSRRSMSPGKKSR